MDNEIQDSTVHTIEEDVHAVRNVSSEEARRFIADSKFFWFQRFHLAPDVITPGVNPVECGRKELLGALQDVIIAVKD